MRGWLWSGACYRFFVINQCSLAFLFADRQSTYEAQIDDTERIAWLWAIVFAFAFPELLTFFRSVRICFFKNVDTPTISQQFFVCLFELLHVIGMGIFCFKILPELDAVKGIMLMNCLCFVPAVLGKLCCSFVLPLNVIHEKRYKSPTVNYYYLLLTFVPRSRLLQLVVAEKLQIITRGYTGH